MATKAQVRKIAKQQGALFLEGHDSLGNYWATVELPNHLDWDNGYGSGACVQTKSYDETMAEFWQSMLYYIDYPVVPNGR